MAIKIKTQEEILQEILNEITVDSVDGIATYENSDARDIFINPLKDQLADANLIGDFISRSRAFGELEEVVRDFKYRDALRFALNLTTAQFNVFLSATIDNLVSNYNEVRTPAQKSRGYIRMYFTSSSAITLNSVLTFSTLDNIKYVTKNTFDAYPPVLDSVTGLYYVDCSIEASQSGQTGNVEAGKIVKIDTSFTNLSKVVNLERTKFGRDIETDLELLTRVKNTLASRNNNTLNGLINKVINYPSVLDASVVMPNDPSQVRFEKNAVDVYILADEKRQVKEDVYNSLASRYAWERFDNELDFQIYPVDSTSGQYYYKLLSQPAISINSVSIASTPDGGYSEIPAELVKDKSSSCAYSVRGHDYIKINNSVIGSNLKFVKVNYTYDRLYKDLQNLYKQYSTQIIGADLLFKKGQELFADVYINMSLLAGYTDTDVQDVIINDLRIFFEGGVDSNNVQRLFFRLGQGFDVSDLLNVCLDIEGVDDVDKDLFTIKINGVTCPRKYLPKLYEFIRLGSVSFTITTGNSSGVTPITRQVSSGNNNS